MTKTKNNVQRVEATFGQIKTLIRMSALHAVTELPKEKRILFHLMMEDSEAAQLKLQRKQKRVLIEKGGKRHQDNSGNVTWLMPDEPKKETSTKDAEYAKLLNDYEAKQGRIDEAMIKLDRSPSGFEVEPFLSEEEFDFIVEKGGVMCEGVRNILVTTS